MLYLNEHMGAIKANILPDMYIADSLSDFLRSKLSINPPSRWSLRNTFTGIGYPGEILVRLPNVDLEKQGDLWNVQDVSNKLEVYCRSYNDLSPESDPLETLGVPRGRYSTVDLLYNPHEGGSVLFGAQRLASPAKKKIVIKGYSVALPAFA